VTLLYEHPVFMFLSCKTKTSSQISHKMLYHVAEILRVPSIYNKRLFSKFASWRFTIM